MEVVHGIVSVAAVVDNGGPTFRLDIGIEWPVPTDGPVADNDPLAIEVFDTTPRGVVHGVTGTEVVPGEVEVVGLTI